MMRRIFNLFDCCSKRHTDSTENDELEQLKNSSSNKKIITREITGNIEVDEEPELSCKEKNINKEKQ